MTIAPNGVAVADYDLTGIGAIVLAAIYRSDYSSNIQFGEVVDGTVVKLRPCSIVDNTTDGTQNITIKNNGDAGLGGNWKCIGYMNLANADHVEVATMFMRVS